MEQHRDPTLPFLVGQGCGIGTYSYTEDSSSCLLCASPLTTTAANTSYCDGCVAGYYWSEDAHTTFLQSNSHEDGFQCTDCCKQCDKGMACDQPGLTVETLVIKEGYWRGSIQSVEIEDCVRNDNCPGSGSESLGGDDLCDDHSKGMLCNACEGGYYLGETGECLTCSSRIKTLVAVIAGFVAVVVIVTLLRPCVSRVPWRKKNWWLTTFFTLWYTARARRAPSPFKHVRARTNKARSQGQSTVIFLHQQTLTPPPPFKYVLKVLEVVTLGWPKSIVFTPCDWFPYYTKIVVVTVAPIVVFLLFLVAAAAHASATGAESRREVFRAYMSTYAVLFILCDRPGSIRSLPLPSRTELSSGFRSRLAVRHHLRSLPKGRPL